MTLENLSLILHSAERRSTWVLKDKPTNITKYQQDVTNKQLLSRYRSPAIVFSAEVYACKVSSLNHLPAYLSSDMACYLVRFRE